MKKPSFFWGMLILILTLIVATSKIVLAQPVAKKICLYPKYEAADDVDLKNLKPEDAYCFEDTVTLGIFNSAKTAILKFTISHGGGYIGTFTDKKSKVHLIRIISTNGIIHDDTSNKTYTIEDADKQTKWYKIVHAAMLQQRKNLK